MLLLGCRTAIALAQSSRCSDSELQVDQRNVDSGFRSLRGILPVSAPPLTVRGLRPASSSRMCRTHIPEARTGGQTACCRCRGLGAVPQTSACRINVIRVHQFVAGTGAGAEQSWRCQSRAGPDPSRPRVSSLTRAVLSATGLTMLRVLSLDASLLLSPRVVSELSISRVSVTVSGNKRDYF